MAQILSISSNVVAGHVGNSASVFALQRLGHQVWPIHTITLPFHPGLGPIPEASRQILPSSAIDADFQALQSQGWLAEIDAISIGYMATPEQSDIVAS